jgi:tetratricopeptide (TPR) repeat protein
MINKENGFDLNIKCDFPDLRKHAFAFISLFILIAIIYGNSLQGEWLFDDLSSIVNNPQIHLKSLSWPEIKNAFFATPQDLLSRSVARFSFALNYYADGLNVFGYHLVNVIIHLISSIFLYLLIYHTLNLPLLREKYQKSSYAIALLAAFLWASSPLHVNAITLIVQRMTSMAGMAYVMSLYFYVKGRTSSGASRRIAFFLLCVVAGGLAIASKENAVMLPIAIFLYDLILIQGVSAESIRKNMPLILIILVTAMAGIVYEIFLTSNLDYQAWTFTMKERLLTEPRVFLFYISLLLYPLGSRLTLDHDIQISRTLLDPWSTLPAILIIVFSIGYALWIARRKPLLSFCILFFFLNHLIEGTIIPLDLIYEHRNYVPAMFFFVPVAILMITVLDYFAYKRSLQFIMFFVMIFLLSSQGHTVYARNYIFSSSEIFWQDNVNKSLYLSRPHGMLGYVYSTQGNYQKSMMESKIALQLSRYPNLAQLTRYHVNIGSAYLSLEMNNEKALFHYSEALRIHPQSASTLVYHNIAFIMLNRNNLKLAHTFGQMGVNFASTNATAHNNFALILFKEGDIDGAIKEANEALALDPNFAYPLAILAESYRIKGNYPKSQFYWGEFLMKNPDHINALLATLELYLQLGEKEKILQTAGKLLYLSRNGNLLDMIKNNKNELFPYSPDPQKLLPIIRNVFLKLANDPADNVAN